MAKQPKRPIRTGRKSSDGRAVTVSASAVSNAPTAPPPTVADTGDTDGVDDLFVSLGSADADTVSLARQQLLTHSDMTVRAAYAGSVATGDELAVLAADVDPVVRSTVAQRWDHPVPEALGDDDNAMVAFTYARRIEVSDDERSRIMSRPDVSRVAGLVGVH